MKLNNELTIALELAYKAGKAIMKVYEGDFDVEYKSDKSPLTIADTQANEIITSVLREEFSYSILAEEEKDNRERLNDEWCWIIDPLDGTKEFVKRNGEFTVNIALTYKKKPVLGIVYVPVSKEMYYAIKDEGAFYKRDGNEFEQIFVSNKESDLILMKSRSHASEKLIKLIENNRELIKESKEAGSALKGCLVAKGEADIYIRFNPTMEWDTCAMHCIVEEAGGVFRQIDSSKMLYNRDNAVNENGFYIMNKMHRLKGL